MNMINWNKPVFQNFSSVYYCIEWIWPGALWGWLYKQNAGKRIYWRGGGTLSPCSFNHLNRMLLKKKDSNVKIWKIIKLSQSHI